jgi:hypothetical protein
MESKLGSEHNPELTVQNPATELNLILTLHLLLFFQVSVFQSISLEKLHEFMPPSPIDYSYQTLRTYLNSPN